MTAELLGEDVVCGRGHIFEGSLWLMVPSRGISLTSGLSKAKRVRWGRKQTDQWHRLACVYFGAGIVPHENTSEMMETEGTQSQPTIWTGSPHDGVYV